MFEGTLNKILKGRMFNFCVDLGCGEGIKALREHCVTIIGVDHNLSRLSVAKKFNNYDKVVYADIKDYKVPIDTDAVFMVESIEHISKQEGISLIRDLEYIPFMLVTTPSKFSTFVFRNGHASLWTPKDFQLLGFKTKLYNRSFPIMLKFGRCIIAQRDVND